MKQFKVDELAHVVANCDAIGRWWIDDDDAVAVGYECVLALAKGDPALVARVVIGLMLTVAHLDGDA